MPKLIKIKIESAAKCLFRGPDGTCYHPKVLNKSKANYGCFSHTAPGKIGNNFPKDCPLKDCFKCDRCHDTGKVDQGFADCDNVIDCPICKGSGNIKITKQTKDAT